MSDFCNTILPGSSWDFPGKNTGVGCHLLLTGIFLTQELNLGLLHFRQIFYWLSYEGSPRLLCAWNSPGQNTGVGSHFLLQEIWRSEDRSPNLGIEPKSRSHWRQILYRLSHLGSPRSRRCLVHKWFWWRGNIDNQAPTFFFFFFCRRFPLSHEVQMSPWRILVLF